MFTPRPVRFGRTLIIASLVGAAIWGLWRGPISAEAAESAVVVMYHRVGEGDYPANTDEAARMVENIRGASQKIIADAAHMLPVTIPVSSRIDPTWMYQ